MNHLKKLWGIWLAAVFLCVLCLSACRKEETPPDAEEGTYQIYYLDSARMKLAPLPYETQTTDPELLIGELAGQILEAPGEPGYQAVLGEPVVLLDLSREENILTVNFSKEYNSMDAIREVLCRAALAKTFTQVAGIDYISITCEGQPLFDRRGNPLGAVSGADFIDSISDVNSFERVELTLYFANETRDGLAAETREVVHSMSTSTERLVVEQLLAGPQEGHNPVLPQETRILSVSVTDSICYVNLDGGFLTGELEAAEYIPVYALVNSLTELPTVNKVQILINGSADAVYRNSISLSSPLEREESYITDLQG